MTELFIVLLYILFVLAAIVLVVVILLQEGRGGGLTDALGTSGQQTFGVGASGITKFTGVTAALFLGSALLIHVLNRQVGGGSVLGKIPAATAPAPDAGAGAGAGAPPVGPTPPPAGPTEPPK
jgi:preprotein translocase subunit SecG